MKVSDLKVISYLLIFVVMFTSVVALVVSSEGEMTEYSTGNINYTEPSLTPFTSLTTGISNLSTGSTFIDGILVTIFGGIVVFLIYRAVRGQ